jgi:hypothetical protein
LSARRVFSPTKSWSFLMDEGISSFLTYHTITSSSRIISLD